MKLLPLDTPALIELAAGWLARKENYQWLDFGGGRQIVSPTLLRIMAQRETHFLRVYTGDDDLPIGILGLNSVDRVFGTATFWGASGDKSFRHRGYSTLGSSLLVGLAFRVLGLRVMHTWVADGNPSRRIVERVGFRFIGRQRQSHVIDGAARDKLLFDLLASEYQELQGERWQRAGRARHEAVAAE